MDNDTDSVPAEAPPAEHPWEPHLDTYPVRPSEADPRWAIWTVWIWVCFDVAMLIFIVLLLILGLFYD